MAIGSIMTARLSTGPWIIGSVGLDVGTLYISSTLIILGYQSVWFALISKAFGTREGLLPVNTKFEEAKERFSLERIAKASSVLAMLGLVAIAGAFSGFRCSRHEESASTPDSRNDVGGPRRAIIVVAHGPFGHGNTVQIRCWLGTVTNGVGVDHSVDCRFTLTRTNHVQPPGLNMMYAVTNQFFNLHRYMEESSIFSAVEETFQAIHGYRTAEKMERLRIA